MTFKVLCFGNVTIYVFDRDEIYYIHLPELTKFFWVDKQFPNSLARNNNHITRWLKISHKQLCYSVTPANGAATIRNVSHFAKGTTKPHVTTYCCVQEEPCVDSINSLLVEWIPAPTRGLEMQFYPMPRRQRDPEITSTAPMTTTAAADYLSCVGVVSVLCFLMWLNKKRVSVCDHCVSDLYTLSY